MVASEFLPYDGDNKEVVTALALYRKAIPLVPRSSHLFLLITMPLVFNSMSNINTAVQSYNYISSSIRNRPDYAAILKSWLPRFALLLHSLRITNHSIESLRITSKYRIK
uniref:TPR_REGION domain-containing protein n=1 Tax=Steinernema glaseri TaxID=37863 RepID=A0A1I8AU09_9BILA